MINLGMASLIDEFPLLQCERVHGLCGCGRPERALDFVCRVLEDMDRPGRDAESYEVCTSKREQVVGLSCEHGGYELILHYLSDLELTEHGGSIFGSWPSEKGRQLVAAWKKLGAEDLEAAITAACTEAINPGMREGDLMGDPDWPYLTCQTCKVTHDCPNKSGDVVRKALDARALIKQLLDAVPDLDICLWRDSQLLGFINEHGDHELVLE